MDHYYEPPLASDDLLTLARSTALGQAAGEPIPWSPEIQSGIWRSPGERVSYPDPTVAEQELYYLAALAFGLKGLNFYMLVNREHWALAPLEPGGAATAPLGAVRKAIRLIERLANLGPVVPISPVALAWQASYARDAYAVVGAADLSRARPYDAMVEAFAALTRAGYLPRIWHTEYEPPKDITAIVSPSASYMPHDAQLQLARRGKEGTRVVLLGDPPHTEEIGRPSDALVKAVCIGDVSSVTSATELAVALRDRGVEAPVCVDGEDGFAIMHQAPDQQLLFVLNPETARTTFSLRFASSRVLALRPLASEGPDVPVADQTARITLAPHTGTVFQAIQ